MSGNKRSLAVIGVGLAFLLSGAVNPADYADLVRRQGEGRGYVNTRTGEIVSWQVGADLYTQGWVIPEEGLGVGLKPLPGPGLTYPPRWYTAARGLPAYTPLPWSPAMTPDP